MQITIDSVADAAYVQLSDGLVASTVEIDVGTFVDVDSRGRVVGIEIIAPARSWPLETIAERFELDSDSYEMLRSIYRPKDHGSFQFNRPIEIVAVAS